jgi:hypothetical protein
MKCSNTSNAVGKAGKAHENKTMWLELMFSFLQNSFTMVQVIVISMELLGSIPLFQKGLIGLFSYKI